MNPEEQLLWDIFSDKESRNMDIKHGRRKSFDIEYVTVTEENIDDVASWCGGVVNGEGKERFIKISDKGAIHQIQTKAFLGDVVVHALELNTFKKFSSKAFGKSYEETDVVEHSRSADTGRYVSDEEAAANPETTVTETTEVPKDV